MECLDRTGCTQTRRLIGNLAPQMNWELRACIKNLKQYSGTGHWTHLYTLNSVPIAHFPMCSEWRMLCRPQMNCKSTLCTFWHFTIFTLRAAYPSQPPCCSLCSLQSGHCQCTLPRAGVRMTWPVHKTFPESTHHMLRSQHFWKHHCPSFSLPAPDVSFFKNTNNNNSLFCLSEIRECNSNIYKFYVACSPNWSTGKPTGSQSVFPFCPVSYILISPWRKHFPPEETLSIPRIHPGSGVGPALPAPSSRAQSRNQRKSRPFCIDPAEATD